MERREFVEMCAKLTGGLFLDHVGLFSTSISKSSYDRGWNVRDHFEEWMNSKDFHFPFDRKRFEYPELVMVMKGEFDKYKYSPPKRSPFRGRFYLDDRERYLTNIFSPDKGIYCAKLNLCTKENLEIQVRVSESLENLSKECRVYNLGNVIGAVNVIIPIEFIQSDNIFYQVSYKDGKGSFKPVSPPRCFQNPRYRSMAVICSYGDHHMFDDLFAEDWNKNGWGYPVASPLTKGGSAIEDGLEGRFFWDFFTKSFINPDWADNVDKSYEHNLKCLRNTYHKANLYAYLARENIWPDLIVDGGDGTGIQDYRYRRQGLPLDDHRGNAYKLLRRERRCSPLTPIAPEVKIRANHDGFGVWNPAHPHVNEFMPLIWSHPGELEGSSPQQNYYIIPLANGRVVHMALDSVSYSHTNGNHPYRPEHWVAGEEQKSWINEKTKKIDADLVLVDHHNCFGGIPKNPDLTEWGGYGRGKGDNREYYEKWNRVCNYPPYYKPIDVNAVDQPKINEILSKVNTTVLLRKYHDHIETEPEEIGKTSKGLIYSMHVGTPNEVVEEKKWREDLDCWIPEYGQAWEGRYLNSPTLNITTVTGNNAHIQTACISQPDPYSNLKYFNNPVKIGDVLKYHVIPL